MFLLDTHCDTPGEILRGRDLSIDNVNAHVDFPKLKRGGVDAAFLPYLCLQKLMKNRHMNMQ